MSHPEKPQAMNTTATQGGNIELTGTVVSTVASPAATMSARRLRSEDYNGYSSTDASPDGSPPEGLSGLSSPSSYQRFGEADGTT